MNKFKFINYEEDIEYSYQLLMEIFRYSKFYYSKIKSISNRVNFKSKNNLKLIFELDIFLNNVNFDKLCLLQIWIIYSLLISPFNNELNKDEIMSILEFIKTTTFDYSKEKYEIWKYSISNIELIIYSILREIEQFKINYLKMI